MADARDAHGGASEKEGRRGPTNGSRYRDAQEATPIFQSRPTSNASDRGAGQMSQDAVGRKGQSRDQGTKKSEFACDRCGQLFKRKHRLVLHTRMHTGHKPHKCGLCGKTFAELASLRNHEFVHSNKRPHACPFCFKPFKLRHHLKRHSVICHNIELPPCGALGQHQKSRWHLQDVSGKLYAFHGPDGCVVRKFPIDVQLCPVCHVESGRVADAGWLTEPFDEPPAGTYFGQPITVSKPVSATLGVTGRGGASTAEVKNEATGDPECGRSEVDTKDERVAYGGGGGQYSGGGSGTQGSRPVQQDPRGAYAGNEAVVFLTPMAHMLVHPQQVVHGAHAGQDVANQWQCQQVYAIPMNQQQPAMYPVPTKQQRPDSVYPAPTHHPRASHYQAHHLHGPVVMYQVPPQGQPSQQPGLMMYRLTQAAPASPTSAPDPTRLPVPTPPSGSTPQHPSSRRSCL
eukprot:Clim_evm16s239 gene=Clim_evmTU16s239